MNRILGAAIVLAGLSTFNRTPAHGQDSAGGGGSWRTHGRISGSVFYSEVKSPLGLYTYDGSLVVTPDGHWTAAEYPVVIRTDTPSVAQRAGLQPGDVILTVNGHDARGGNRVWRLPPSETAYLLHLRRGDTEMDVVMERPGPGGGQKASAPAS